MTSIDLNCPLIDLYARLKVVLNLRFVMRSTESATSLRLPRRSHNRTIRLPLPNAHPEGLSNYLRSPLCQSSCWRLGGLPGRGRSLSA